MRWPTVTMTCVLPVSWISTGASKIVSSGLCAAPSLRMLQPRIALRNRTRPRFDCDAGNERREGLIGGCAHGELTRSRTLVAALRRLRARRESKVHVLWRVEKIELW